MRSPHLFRSLLAAASLGLSLTCAIADPKEFINLDQGWTPELAHDWHTASQGSRLIPYDWLLALEQAGSRERFLDPKNIEKYRYLPGDDGGPLPLGFAKDTSNDEAYTTTRLRWKQGQGPNEPWVGMNCAACHTGEIHYNGHVMRVEGGPAMADFQGFMKAFDAALDDTAKQPEKFERFADKVLGAQNSPDNRLLLRRELKRLTDWENKLAKMNYTTLSYGFGRLDAFGHIYNKVAAIVGVDHQERNPPDAPVSYPFIWNAPQMKWVQYNAMAPNMMLVPGKQPFDFGALLRNVGEAVGVFADVTPKKKTFWLSGFSSSVQIKNLVKMEQMIGKLKPPAWPAAVFGRPDDAKVAQGKRLFEKACKDCHKPFDRTDLNPLHEAKIIRQPLRTAGEDRTDPWAACNAVLAKSKSGVLEGTREFYVFGNKILKEDVTRKMVGAVVAGVVAAQKKEVLESIIASALPKHDPFLGGSGSEDARQKAFFECMNVNDAFVGYKARPLTGIWATGPYLHDGSVPTLTELLKPADQRMKSFWTGSREFDPVNVGFITWKTPENWLEFVARRGDKPVYGNSNEGHNYGTNLSVPEREALIEYLKTL